ncbi:MAG: thioredoxin [Anaerolineales bacterium]|nr:thioredoxin [Anaerolineales bacterium]
MAELHVFTDDNFQAQVLESSAPVLVDFTAEWCPPCHMLAPVVADLNTEWNGAVKVGQLDADNNVNATMQYGVLGLPTLILFKDGRPVERLTGFMPRERILAKLKPHLSAD